MPIKHATIRKAAIVLAFLGFVHPGFAATATTTNQHNTGRHTSAHHHRTAKKSSKHHSTHHVQTHKTAHHTGAKTVHTSSQHTKHTYQHHLTPTAPKVVPATDLSNVSDNINSTEPPASPLNNTTAVSDSTTPPTSTGERLVSDVHSFISSLHYTHYKTGGEVFDSTKGIYELDCSHYVDNILARGAPAAYSNLVSSTGAQSPNSANYYNFFTRLSSNFRTDWDRVDNAKDLQPGDVLVFRYRSSRGSDEGGHVMLVMDKPVQDNDSLLVRVSDSAFAGHSDDTRPAHNSGVGIGTLVLKVDQLTGQPFAYAWDIDSPLQSRVNIAMGRPVDVG